MNFKEKLRAAWFKARTRLIVGIFLMILIIILACAPLSISIQDAANSENKGTGVYDSNYDSEKFIEDLGKYVPNPGLSIKTCFTKEYFSSFFKSVEIVFGVYFVLALIGLYKAIPKHEYDDIEHGSGKFAEGGEEYAVLNKKKGIILAEKHYLPVDKRGNVNVLVVRRFWCW